jgi:uncharacterized protein
MKSIFPIYSFFCTLQKHPDFSLGVEEYNVLLNVLVQDVQHEYLENQEKMRTLCRLLWYTPNQNSHLFNKLFDQSFEYLADEKEGENIDSEKADKQGNSPPRDEKDELPKSSDKNQTNKELNQQAEKPQNTSNLNKKEEVPPLFLNFQKGVGQNLQGEESFKRDFTFIKNYTPLKERELALCWRYFRVKTQSNNTLDEIDIAKTIEKFANNASLHIPVFKQKKENKATLITFIDHKGSMIAFKNIALNIANAARLSNNITNKIYFFKNVPQRYNSGDEKGEMYVYENQGQTKHKSIKKIMSEFPDASILIISDAGTARNDFNMNRIQATEEFLTETYTATTKIAWLNPMPEDRWDTSSAFIIREMVDMFEANSDGLTKAINILRGKTKPHSAILFPDTLV